jgi:hypothetical protein
VPVTVQVLPAPVRLVPATAQVVPAPAQVLPVTVQVVPAPVQVVPATGPVVPATVPYADKRFSDVHKGHDNVVRARFQSFCSAVHALQTR